MFFVGERRRPGFAETFIESLVADAIMANIRMKNVEWEIYTDVLARFLGVDLIELRTKIIKERARCRDLRTCRDRIFFWAYRRVRPW